MAVDCIKLRHWVVRRKGLPAGAKLALGYCASRHIASITELARLMQITRSSAARHVQRLRAEGLLCRDSLRASSARPYRAVQYRGVVLQAGACRRIAQQLSVTPSLVYKVAKGAKSSARIRRMLDALAERQRRAG